MIWSYYYFRLVTIHGLAIILHCRSIASIMWLYCFPCYCRCDGCTRSVGESCNVYRCRLHDCRMPARLGQLLRLRLNVMIAAVGLVLIEEAYEGVMCYYKKIMITDLQITIPWNGMHTYYQWQVLVLSSGIDSMGHGGHVPPTFTNGWARGHRE